MWSYFTMCLGEYVYPHTFPGGGRVMRRCWVNCQCQGALLIWIIVGQGPIALAVGAGGACLDNVFLSSIFSLFFLPLWKTARYGLKYCLHWPFNPTQPTIKHTFPSFYKPKQPLRHPNDETLLQRDLLIIKRVGFSRSIFPLSVKRHLKGKAKRENGRTVSLECEHIYLQGYLF